jgi:hypothetical protein
LLRLFQSPQLGSSSTSAIEDATAARSLADTATILGDIHGVVVRLEDGGDTGHSAEISQVVEGVGASGIRYEEGVDRLGFGDDLLLNAHNARRSQGLTEDAFGGEPTESQGSPQVLLPLVAGLGDGEGAPVRARGQQRTERADGDAGAGAPRVAGASGAL